MAMTLKTSIEGDELLTKEQMYTVDAAAIKNGISAGTLMENAGRAVVVEITKRFKCQPITVFCGTGNNGGDGFAAAYFLNKSNYNEMLPENFELHQNYPNPVSYTHLTLPTKA